MAAVARVGGGGAGARGCIAGGFALRCIGRIEPRADARDGALGDLFAAWLAREAFDWQAAGHGAIYAAANGAARLARRCAGAGLASRLARCIYAAAACYFGERASAGQHHQ